ncbi:MAG TPA: hypothetical protein VFQ80_09725 [Thermomicrobiales bacterium]|nr:hypothetical protein [Thermomicrobiales bacterium]
MTKAASVLVAVATVFVLAEAFAFWNEGAARKSSCPSGTQKFVHVCIEKTARPPAAFADASAACAAEKRRLPTSAELDGFRQQSGVTLASPAEWSSDFTSATSATVMSDAGAFGNNALTTATPFRCVA